jgi:L-cystine uptake protein TcyP (sodium:dicarboxylate symporter family)
VAIPAYGTSKVHPVLLPPSVTLFAAKPVHVAPPVAALSVIVAYVGVTVPVVWEMVARVPGVVLFSTIGLAADPENAKVPALLVVPALSESVPPLNVSVRVEPTVKASCNCHVTP